MTTQAITTAMAALLTLTLNVCAANAQPRHPGDLQTHRAGEANPEVLLAIDGSLLLHELDRERFQRENDREYYPEVALEIDDDHPEGPVGPADEVIVMDMELTCVAPHHRRLIDGLLFWCEVDVNGVDAGPMVCGMTVDGEAPSFGSDDFLREFDSEGDLIEPEGAVDVVMSCGR
jgi:hypothetical protein